MSDINYHENLFELLQPLQTADIDSSYIEISYSEDIEQKCKLVDIRYERILEKLRLFTSSIQTKVFKDLEEFLLVREINDSSNFFIVNGNQIISYIDKKTYIDFKYIPNNYLITNTKAYLEFLNLLKTQERESEDAFCFVDSYNKDLRKITLVSLSEAGRINISYGLKAPLFDMNKDFRVGLKKFSLCFEDDNKSLAKFLKSASISITINFPNNSRLQQFFESLEDIVEKAQINFEVYLNNLSIEKIRKDYDEVKSKYFSSLSDILSNLSQKIIVLPIGIAALLFAVDKLKDAHFFLCILIGVILITSIYISLLLKVHFKDLTYIKNTFQFDYKALLENNFFNKYPDEAIFFEQIKKRIEDRIAYLKLIIESYYWIMNIANIIITSFILRSLSLPYGGITLIALALLMVVTLLRNYFLEKYET